MAHPAAVATAIVALACIATSCADGPTDAASPSETSSATMAATAPPVMESASPSVAPTPTPTPTPTVEPATDAELAAAGVNELGRVVIGEWHIIGDADGEYRTSRETFRLQLEELYERGYRPVTQQELIDGTMPIPFGTSPIVLTFDDSTRGHLALDAAGLPTPDSAVGIIEQFASEHSDWRATAVFAFNFPDPFGDADVEPKMRWLVDNGYELSNHSRSHTNLGSLTSSEVVENLADNQASLHALLPEASVPSLTLPFGAWPDDRAVAASGTGPAGTYLHELIYLVGSDPNRSPHHIDFDPLAIQRVPAHAVVGTGPEWFGSWLDRLDSEGLRFVSDGLADVVTYPADLQDIAAVDATFEQRTYGTS